MVAKLNKEKRQWAEGRQKNEEDLQAAEDRANHLNRVKVKLEQSLDEMEDSVEREKKVWGIIILCQGAYLGILDYWEILFVQGEERDRKGP